MSSIRDFSLDLLSGRSRSIYSVHNIWVQTNLGDNVSSKQVKTYRRVMRKELEAHKREDLALLIFQMKSLPLKQRVLFALKIIRGNR